MKDWLFQLKTGWRTRVVVRVTSEATEQDVEYAAFFLQAVRQDIAKKQQPAAQGGQDR